jgi:hypothetical protein
MAKAAANPKAITKSSPTETAIDRCERARKTAYEAEYAKSRSRAVASIIAAEAYRHAMPPLCSSDNVRDFISCVAHGLLIGVLDESKSSRLLYAASIASTSFRAAKSLPTCASGKDKSPSGG